MSFLVIVVSLIVVWIASLCKILHSGSSYSKNTFLSYQTVHQTGEMFCLLLPTLMMSPCNADGMGNTRKDELYQACLVLKVQPQQVKILDHPDLQDGFGLVWDRGLLSKTIKEEVSTHHIDTVITFDKFGVSGHCNHRDVHYGVRKLLEDASERRIEAWELVSSSMLRKYIGPVDIWMSMLLASKSDSRVAYCLLNEQPWKSFSAMAAHSSQWVWFRKLFVSFSSYTYVNTLRRIN